MNVLDPQKRAHVRDLIEAGASQRYICRVAKVSKDTVCNIRRQMRRESALAERIRQPFCGPILFEGEPIVARRLEDGRYQAIG